jgi:pyruvate formate lyase activating enzyme
MENIPPTPIHTLQEAKRIAEEEGIRHVYLGNV